MAPSSRFARSLKPNDEYLVLNFCALWKKQTTLPSFAYAGIPYHSFGERAGALALMIAWNRSAMARSGSGISAILASTALSASAPAASAFSSSAENPLNFLVADAVLLADLCVPVFAVLLPAIAKHLLVPNESQR